MISKYPLKISTYIPSEGFLYLMNFIIILLGISIILIVDQITPLLFKRIDYFKIEGILFAILFHVLVSLVFLSVLS